jgi:hypothetical protein
MVRLFSFLFVAASLLLGGVINSHAEPPPITNFVGCVNFVTRTLALRQGNCKRFEFQVNLVQGGATDLCQGTEVLLGNGECFDICDVSSKTVFVTSQEYDSNLLVAAQTNFPADCSGVTTGLEGADCICQQLAKAQGLKGTYKAWLSTDSQSPSTRFTQSGCPYVLVNGTTVADNWSDLTDGSLDNSIRIDETGANRATGTDDDLNGNESVRTNTAQDGTSLGLQDCGDWTTNSSGDGGVRGGMLDEAGGTWTNQSIVSFTCDSLIFLYCFEQ